MISVKCKDAISAECLDSIPQMLVALSVGEKLQISAEHDPLPAWMQLRFEREHPGEFVWAYAEIGPKWELEFERMRTTNVVDWPN